MTGASGETAGWLAGEPGSFLRRSPAGTIARLGECKAMPGVWIDFGAGMRKLLDIRQALPHLRPRRPQDPATPADPRERCDHCGGRPVVVSVTGSEGTRRACVTHRARVAEDLRR
jgi:hypothetical protein